MSNRNRQFILWFSELGIKDVPVVGGKNASLGEMYRLLTKKGVRIPNGFAITAHAYQYLLERGNLREKMKDALHGLKKSDVEQLASVGRKVREMILAAEFPDDLRREIVAAYQKLSKEYPHPHHNAAVDVSEIATRTLPASARSKRAISEYAQEHAPGFSPAVLDVAVRSSATAEDLPDASFAGQQETYLNVVGEHELIDSCKKCFASLFTNRAISYREDKGFDHFQVSLSIGVQKMVRADLASSGVMFSIDTETGFKHAVFITAIYGLGENIVQGAVNPDEYYVFKPTLRKYRPILSKKIGDKKIKMIYSDESKHPTKNVVVAQEDRERFVLADDEILLLARWAALIEQHYGKPMDMEWAKDGRTNQLFIVQARPETVMSRKQLSVLEEYQLGRKGEIIATGKSVGSKIGAGKANVIKEVKDISRFHAGEVLVTDMTDPDWEPIMKIAAAIVTNRGGRTSHAAIVSRELGLPCVVGTTDGTRKIKHGEGITVSCAEGEEGYVYRGILPFAVRKTDIRNLKRPKTKIMMNIANPEQAFEHSFIPNDGVGLAREEFIINEYIKIHPNALLNYSKITDPALKEKIDELTRGYPDKVQFYIERLASGIAMIAAAFWPNPVIVRFSDFKTNEYANLIGGTLYEPNEENPMIGWRGASRYYSPGFQQAFALECKAIKKVREMMGLKNVVVMIPFCRTVEEGRHVLAEMKKNGLERGKNRLEVYMMCEIPSNVVLADEFSKLFDGFSIGSNDLTQLTLGLDRDSAIVSNLFDERNAAVRKMVALVIHKAKKNHRKIGICGDAPSTYPDFALFLVHCGIDSISLSPDAVIKTTIAVHALEQKLHH
ncbi:phosphoenolpyruvate synthase [Candidatus Woesearchaeota archaeon]|nr:phosphoenolpyruvate synthase [Candidatus Woesearchaeota archaeon]